MADTDDPTDGSGLGGIETVEGLRVLALTQERRLAKLEATADTLQGDKAAILREIAEARADLRHIKDRIATMKPDGPTPSAPGFYDNAERGFSALLSTSIGRIIASALFILVLGVVVVTAILAWKGDLDDVVRGAFTPGEEVVNVPAGTVVDEPPAGDPEVIE